MKYGKIGYKRGWFPVPEHIISHGKLFPGPLATLSPAALRMLIYIAAVSRGEEVEIANADLMKFADLNRFNIQKARAELRAKKLLRVTRLNGGGRYRYHVCEAQT